MNTFWLKIVASNKVFYDGECVSLVIPAADGGLYGFLPHHENVFVPIDFGEMRFTTPDGEEISAFVGNGLLEFSDNTANLVCISVESPEEIDQRRAEEAKLRAEEELRQQQSIYEYYLSRANLSRAMERLKVKNRHKI